MDRTMEAVPKDGEDEADFSVILSPHRSLNPQAFLILMVFVCAVSFAAGMVFLLMGAWPIMGFFGLDVFLIYLAFTLNYRAARRREIIEIKDDQLNISVISPNGSARRQSFQAYWSRLEMRGGKLVVRCKSDGLEIGQFLLETEKEDVKEALTTALHHYRHGLAV